MALLEIKNLPISESRQPSLPQSLSIKQFKWRTILSSKNIAVILNKGQDIFRGAMIICCYANVRFLYGLFIKHIMKLGDYENITNQ